VRALGSKVWVVNVFSSRDPGQITPLAVTLMRKGYPAYSTRATVKGSEWTRLRVGFFKDKNEAEKAAQRITAILGGVATTWVVRIGQDELERFGGY
jgi:cell division septation protein DedD